VSAHEGAYADEEIRKWLHHVVVVERFFLGLFRHRPYDWEREKQVPDSIEEIEQRFQEAHADGAAYTASLTESELARQVDFPVPSMKDFHPSVRDALMQVIMHSEHHRAQVAMRLRALGGSPPVIDYIIWVRDVKGRA